jgi:hypothetical protein
MAVCHQGRTIRGRGAGANLRESLLFVLSPYRNVSMIFIVVLLFLSDGIAYIRSVLYPQLMVIGS